MGNDPSNPPDGMTVHRTAFARLSTSQMADHLRGEHKLAIHDWQEQDRATLLTAHQAAHQSDGYDQARATFVDDITMPVARAVQAGIRAEDIRADFEALLSIQAVTP